MSPPPEWLHLVPRSQPASQSEEGVLGRLCTLVAPVLRSATPAALLHLLHLLDLLDLLRARGCDGRAAVVLRPSVGPYATGGAVSRCMAMAMDGVGGFAACMHAFYPKRAIHALPRRRNGLVEGRGWGERIRLNGSGTERQSRGVGGAGGAGWHDAKLLGEEEDDERGEKHRWKHQRPVWRS